MAEFRRAMERLHLPGAMLFSNVNGVALADQRYWNLYEVANEGRYFRWWAPERYSESMGWHDGLRIQLSRADRKQVGELLSGGVQPVRTVLRALVLRQMNLDFIGTSIA